MRLREQRRRGRNVPSSPGRDEPWRMLCVHYRTCHQQHSPNRTSVLTFPTLIRGGSGINVVPGLM